jgi:hypothetical protein
MWDFPMNSHTSVIIPISSKLFSCIKKIGTMVYTLLRGMTHCILLYCTYENRELNLTVSVYDQFKDDINELQVQKLNLWNERQNMVAWAIKKWRHKKNQEQNTYWTKVWNTQSFSKNIIAQLCYYQLVSQTLSHQLPKKFGLDWLICHSL